MVKTTLDEIAADLGRRQGQDARRAIVLRYT
eukprot:COSAG02_NODE_45628_length_355_cov_1.000000_2_plen_30_part_01